MPELIKFSSKDLETIKRQIAPNINDTDFHYCMSVAKELGLNPLLKQIQFVPRRVNINNQWIEKYEPLVGRDGYLTIAHKYDDLEELSSKTEIKEYPVLKDNVFTMSKELVATAVVKRKEGVKITSEVSFSEYAQYTKDGNLTTFWKNKPHTMLKKVAESQALRKAYNVTGVYSQEEVLKEALRETESNVMRLEDFQKS